MGKRNAKDQSTMMSDIIIHGIQEKKGHDIVSLDLRNIKSAESDYFIICHADSSNQAKAIADSVEEEMFKAFHEEVWHKEGFENCEWILLDYSNVVVHIFKKEKREFYGIEDLWGDAPVKNYLSA